MAQDPLTLAIPWVEKQLGRPLNQNGGWPEVDISESTDKNPFVLFRTGMAVHGVVCEEWLDDVRAVSESLHPDLLFSPVGCYDLSRITLKVPARGTHPGGTGIWGPVPAYVADSEMWKPIDTGSVIKLSPHQLSEVDWKTFWHCYEKDRLTAFGIYESGNLVALATVKDDGAGLMEIGVDVSPEAKGRRLGSAVVSAVGNWVLDNDGTIFATAAAWNVPSTRNLRSLGMEYAFSGLWAEPAPFRQPPQTLGSPAPGVEMINHYPDWATNKDIKPSPEDL